MKKQNKEQPVIINLTSITSFKKTPNIQLFKKYAVLKASIGEFRISAKVKYGTLNGLTLA